MNPQAMNNQPKNTFWVLRNGSIECQVSAVNQNVLSHGFAGANLNRAGLASARSETARRSGLTRRGRAVVALAALAFAGPIVAGAAGGQAPPEPQHVVTYQVTAGESLWTIAERYKEPGTDTRDMVRHIKRLNHLDSSDIFAGQVIVVEVEP